MTSEERDPGSVPADAVREVGQDPRHAVELPAAGRFGDEVDEASDESFPASDPPSFTGGGGSDMPPLQGMDPDEA